MLIYLDNSRALRFLSFDRWPAAA